MTNVRLEQLLTAANPLSAERATRLRLDEAERELLASVMATPRPASSVQSVRRRRRVAPRLAVAIGAVALVLVAALSLVGGRGERAAGTAWAAEQVRFAEASPLVLLGAPGWHVEYADEQSSTEGELHFRIGSRTAQLNWRGGTLGSWTKDRAASAAVTATAPVLGTTAHVFQYEGGTPGRRDITALFRYDDRVLEFRAGAAGVSAFKALLATLERVDTDAWLSALPASAVKVADRATVVKRMLTGIAVPPGFDASDIRGADLTKDRYQLGAAVTGTVACQWFKRWFDARNAGDRATEREAVAAMAGAKHWPILKEMAKDGAYPDVLWAFVRAMPSGRWYGRPLIGDVNEGLGCAGYGVDLPKLGAGR